MSEVGNLVIQEYREGVLTLTLNRPDQFNALSDELLTAFQDALDRHVDDPALRVVVVAGAGKAFCAGQDLKQMRSHTGDQAYYQQLFEQGARLMQSIVHYPVPVIARVHGTATAAGCQLVASCDLAIAADSARFAVSGINVGLFCSTPAVALTRNMPLKAAFEMLVTGRFISAEEAQRTGLINHAVPADELDRALDALVQTICDKSPAAIRTGKAMYRRQCGMNLGEAYAYASGVMAASMVTDDAGEGIDAFMQKRPPKWTGR